MRGSHAGQWVMALAVAAAAAAAGCGRIGYDPTALDGLDAVAVDAADLDGLAIDALPACPTGTVPLCAGAAVCIEVDERGNADWTTARDTCLGAGRRLCADAEWALGCGCEPTLTEMFLDGAGASLEWEWVAEESGGTAQKRGYDSCDATSTHAIVDAYDYRCCADR